MSFILQTDSFIETGGCDGPRNTRSQPSRETTGVTMTEIQDKYIPEFELPYRNVDRYIKEIRNNWNRLNEGQRDSVRKSFREMKMGDITKEEKEGFEGVEYNGTLDSSVSYIYQDPRNVRRVLTSAWNPTEAQVVQFSLEREDVKKVRDNIYDWSLENGLNLHTNWKSGGAALFIFLISFILGILVGALSK